jgi:hypothetical protein
MADDGDDDVSAAAALPVKWRAAGRVQEQRRRRRALRIPSPSHTS